MNASTLMNMDETKLYSWFLGPKAENADMLERLVLEALRDCVFWRRNFHPEDDIIITEKVKAATGCSSAIASVARRNCVIAWAGNWRRNSRERESSALIAAPVGASDALRLNSRPLPDCSQIFACPPTREAE
jgi:hypothetical protein